MGKNYTTSPRFIGTTVRDQGIKEMEEKCILVSTQLIEAGVDIDFISFIVFLPHDSINQTVEKVIEML